MEVSVAYQGGGARVLELMAACRACRSIQDESGAIKVSRVSGSSAGAIAAAMHATECDVEKIVRGLPKLKAKVEDFFPSSHLAKWHVLFRFTRGLPIYNEADVRKILIEIFDIGGVDATRPVKELVKKGYELRILRSDLKANSSDNVDENSSESLVDALVDSAAIPFVFRTPKTTNKPQLLDGGLFQNLPTWAAAEGLKPHQTVLAFSFAKNHGTTKESFSLLEYGKAILNSLIDERVEGAIQGIKKDNVLLLKQRRTTLDFESIFSSDAHENFLVDVEGTKESIHDWTRSRYGPNGTDWHSSHAIDVASAAEQMRVHALDFFATNKSKEYSPRLIRQQITYESLQSNNPDTIQLEIHLDGIDNPGLQFLEFKYMPDSEIAPLRKVDVTVQDSNGNARKALLLPFRIDCPRGITTLLCLDKPLSAGDDITIKKIEQIYNGLTRYEREGMCWQTVRLTPGKIPKMMEIISHFRDADFPLHYGDALPNRATDAPIYIEVGPANQLSTTTAQVPHLKPGWKSLVSKVDLTRLTEGMNFASVTYYKQ
ncbi:patatin-like phospholipase family protein [Stenotrophomonas muris]|uniref:patatin-like phospholipase family protein n=1 Tax=Stenotrophomonas muris TaxID=2963283 RepID=UPI0021C63BEC|nr:patatin-like phospholipase family protein [Stenotrophomonas maltophilia]